MQDQLALTAAGAVTAGPPPAAPRQPDAPQGKGYRLSLAMAFSLLLHGAVVIFLIYAQFSARGTRAPPVRIQVTIVTETARDTGRPRATAAALPPPAKEIPKEVPKEALPVPVPQPTPKKPVPPKKETPRPAEVAKPQPPQAAPAPIPSTATAPAPKRGDEGDSPGLTMLGRVRENWLRPAHSSPTFRCRLQIDYRSGGMIANVKFLDGCGNDPLDDSVIRAVYKTQPLPLGPKQASAGSLVLDFSP